MRVRIQFRTLCSRTARHEIAVLLTLVLLPMTVQALGDWHGDKPFTPTAASLRADWQRLGAQPVFATFRGKVSVLATWDNHDYGSHSVVLLTGNVHFAELSVWRGGTYPLYELTSSGMTHVEPAYAVADNRYRVVGPAVEHNFGLLEIDWDVEPWPMLTLKAMNEDGSVVVSHEISLGDLQ